MTEAYYSLGDDYEVEIPLPNGETHKQSFVLALRDDPPQDMVMETVQQFCYAVTALANGIDCKDDYTKRTDFELPPLPYNRVLISFANVAIPLQDGDEVKHVSKRALIFSEHTSAFDFMEAVKSYALMDAALAELGVIRTTRRVAAFNTNSGISTPQETLPGKSGETPYFEQAPNRQELGDNYDKQTVAIKVVKIDVGFKDGQRTYEMFSTYRGDVSMYSFDTTRIYGKKRDGTQFQAVKDNATVAYLEALDMGTHDVDTRAVFWVERAKNTRTNKDGEEYYPTYLNLNKLDIAHEQAPQSGEESQVPDYKQSNEDKKVDGDIPF